MAVWQHLDLPSLGWDLYLPIFLYHNSTMKLHCIQSFTFDIWMTYCALCPKMDLLLDFVDYMHSNMKLTAELESNNVLAFLDMRLACT